MTSLQYVTISQKKILSSFKIYILSLLLTITKKNCASMSRSTGFSYSSISNSLDCFISNKKAIQKYLISLIHLYSTKENPGVLISDSSQLMKPYARKIEGLGYDYNGCMKAVFRGITNTTLAWSNGKITIPIEFDFWISKKSIKKPNRYRKKTEIAKDQIFKWKNKIPFKYVLLDGEYGNEEFIRFLKKNDILYSIRMACNRNVCINGIKAQLRNHITLKLVRNQKYKMAFGYYKGIPANFIAHKRKGKKGSKQIIFIVSNIEGLCAKEHILVHKKRWPIEKMFRTLKQSLGITECQSTSAKKQEAHIYATFLAFVELEKMKIDKKKKSPEKVVHEIRFQNSFKKMSSFNELEGLIM